MRLSLLLLSLFLLTPAHAADPWTTAIGHYKDHQYAKALPLFRALKDGPRAADAQFQIARCQDKLGHPLKAIAAYRAYLHLPDKDAATRARVRKRVKDLIAQTHTTLTVRCADAGLTLKLKHGATVYPLNCGQPARIPAGSAALVVRYQGRPLHQRTLRLTVDQPTKLALQAFPRLNITTSLPEGIPATLTINGDPPMPLPLLGHLVPAGPYQLTITAPGRQTLARTTTLAMGTSLDWQADLPLEAQPTQAAQPKPTSRTLAWLLTGGATLSALTSGYLLYRSSQLTSESEDLRLQYGATDDPIESARLRQLGNDKVADANLHSTLGYTGLGLTAVLGGLAIWQFTRTPAQTALMPLPGGGLLVWSHPW